MPMPAAFTKGSTINVAIAVVFAVLIVPVTVLATALAFSTFSGPATTSTVGTQWRFDDVTAGVDIVLTLSDEFGNRCDANLNNGCMTDFLDLGLMTSVFFCGSKEIRPRQTSR